MRIVTLATPPSKTEIEMIHRFVTYPSVIVHIRKPEISLSQMAAFVSSFDPMERKQLVLHQYQTYSHDWGIERIHYSASQRSKADIGDNDSILKISTSTHSWQEFNGLAAHYDAAFISPIYASISKKNYNGNEVLLHTEQRSNFDTQLIALGGVSPHNIGNLCARFDDFAVCGGLWLAPDPLREFNAYHTQWHEQYG